MRPGNTTVTEIFALAGAIVALAGLSMIIINGGKTAKVINAAGSTFVKSIRAATFQ